MSEVYRHVISVSVTIAVAALLASLTFLLSIYLDYEAASKTAQLAVLRLRSLITYGASSANVSLGIHLYELAVSRPVEVYVVNANTIEIRVPMHVLHGVRISRIIKLDEGVRIDYVGLLPRDALLRFVRVGDVIRVEVIA